MDGLFTQELIGTQEVEDTNQDMVVIDPVMEETDQEVEVIDLEVEEDPVVVEEDLEEAVEDLEEEEDMEVVGVVVAVVDVKIKTVAFSFHIYKRFSFIPFFNLQTFLIPFCLCLLKHL